MQNSASDVLAGEIVPAGSSEEVAGSKPFGLIGFGPLSRLLHPVRWHLIGCCVLSAAGAAAGIAPFIAIAEIARVALGRSDAAPIDTGIWTWVAIGSVGACIRLLLVFASSRLGHYADAETLHDIRVRIVRHLGIVPLGWFRASGSGAVKKVMTTDLETMHELIARALREIIGAATVMVVGLGYLLLIDWRLALVTGAVLAAMWLFYRVAMRSASTHMARLLAAEGQISTASVEYADGITVVKTFGTSGRILDRFASAVREYTQAMHAWVSETRYSTAAARVLSSEMAVFAAVMVAGLLFVHDGTLAMADLLPFLILGIGLPTSITPAVHGSQGLRKGRLAAANIERVLLLRELAEPARAQAPAGHRIEFDRVSFSYDGRNRVLDAVSFVCEPGTVTAIVGASGAGKTTIASLLPRFYDVTGGAIRIGDVDVRAIPQAQLLSMMSLVFQDVVLLRDTVRENIRIGRPGASDDDVRRAAVAAQIDPVVTALPDGYDTMLGSGPVGLSGGERQRLTIARAILSEAPIVVLDEATASLDPDSETAVQDALGELAAGKTVIVIAHRLHTIAGADQILVFDRGSLREHGRHDQLIDTGGIYARMWRAQTEGVAA